VVVEVGEDRLARLIETTLRVVTGVGRVVRRSWLTGLPKRGRACASIAAAVAFTVVV
jgi:hypothetical protein